MKAELTYLSCPECRGVLFHRWATDEGLPLVQPFLICVTEKCQNHGKKFGVPTVELTEIEEENVLPDPRSEPSLISGEDEPLPKIQWTGENWSKVLKFIQGPEKDLRSYAQSPGGAITITTRTKNFVVLIDQWLYFVNGKLECVEFKDRP